MSVQKVLTYCQFLLLLVILFFLSAILSSRIIQKGEMISVPDLTGKTLAEAQDALAKKKLRAQEKEVAFSDRWEQGRIIEQEPSAGSRIRANRPVRVILSGGSEMIEVPALVGRSLEASSKILAELGLAKGLVSQIHTARYAAGRIMAQDPGPSGQSIKRNTPINFLVSQGEVEPRYLMPDLIGKKATPTISRLSELGFKVADVRYSYYPGLDPGIIIGQFPAHGYGIAKRNLIALEVSR